MLLDFYVEKQVQAIQAQHTQWQVTSNICINVTFP